MLNSLVNNTRNHRLCVPETCRSAADVSWEHGKGSHSIHLRLNPLCLHPPPQNGVDAPKQFLLYAVARLKDRRNVWLHAPLLVAAVVALHATQTTALRLP